MKGGQGEKIPSPSKIFIKGGGVENLILLASVRYDLDLADGNSFLSC